MGRGRAKAKQTKVARDLKYNSQDIDIEKLSKELHGEVNKDDDSASFQTRHSRDYRRAFVFRKSRVRR